MSQPPYPFSWKAYVALVKRLPKPFISRAFGHITDIKLPKVIRGSIYSAFSRLVGVNRQEVELPLKEYPSLNAFFIRKLKPGARPVDTNEESVISPVDGAIAEWGSIEKGSLIQAKNIRYNLSDLLGNHPSANRYEGGSFITIYLSPKDYHRIHSPIAGNLESAHYIPGQLFPVNRPAVALIPDLFVRNERLVAQIEGKGGYTSLIAVGALNVGRISAEFDPDWHQAHGAVTSHRKATAGSRTYQPPKKVEKGQQIMAFHLGSTVILLFEPNTIQFHPDLKKGQPVKLGQPIASYC